MIASIHKICEKKTLLLEGRIQEDVLLLARSRIWAGLISKHNISMRSNIKRAVKFLARCWLSIENTAQAPSKILVSGHERDEFFRSYIDPLNDQLKEQIQFVQTSGDNRLKISGHPALRDLEIRPIYESYVYSRSLGGHTIEKLRLFFDWLVIGLEFQTWHNFWLRQFKANGTAIMLVRVFYSHHMLAASLAAKATCTLVADLQHGKQDNYSFYYGLDKYNKSLCLPDRFVVWSEHHAKTINLPALTKVLGRPKKIPASPYFSKEDYLNSLSLSAEFEHSQIIVVIHQQLEAVDFLNLSLQISLVIEKNKLDVLIVLRLHPNTLLQERKKILKAFAKLSVPNILLDDGIEFKFDECRDFFDGLICLSSTALIDFIEMGKKVLIIKNDVEIPFGDLMWRNNFFCSDYQMMDGVSKLDENSLTKFLQFENSDVQPASYRFDKNEFENLLSGK